MSNQHYIMFLSLCAVKGDKIKDQEILFTTETRYTFDEHVRYSGRVCRFANGLS